MKMSLATYDQLAAAVRPHMTTESKTSERARWNALYASGFDYSEYLYGQGLNDDHIDTALRAIARHV